MTDHSQCGIEKTLAVLGGKWTILVVRDLMPGPRRFSELETTLSGISPRTLATRLKELEDEGLIIRDCTIGHPVYALTDRGRALQPILDQMRAWGGAETTTAVA